MNAEEKIGKTVRLLKPRYFPDATILHPGTLGVIVGTEERLRWHDDTETTMGVTVACEKGNVWIPLTDYTETLEELDLNPESKVP
jgi:hypothetical protein